MIQLTREEVQRVLDALLYWQYKNNSDGKIHTECALYVNLIPLLQSKLAEPAPKPMTDEEIDDALSDIWGSDTGEVLSAHLQRKIARAIEARINRV